MIKSVTKEKTGGIFEGEKKKEFRLCGMKNKWMKDKSEGKRMTFASHCFIISPKVERF